MALGPPVPGAPARKSQLCSTAVVQETYSRSSSSKVATLHVLPGPPNRAGFGHGWENTYFRIGLALATLKVLFPDFGFSKFGFSIRGLFSIGRRDYSGFSSSEMMSALEGTLVLWD